MSYIQLADCLGLPAGLPLLGGSIGQGPRGSDAILRFCRAARSSVSVEDSRQHSGRFATQLVLNPSNVAFRKQMPIKSSDLGEEILTGVCFV